MNVFPPELLMKMLREIADLSARIDALTDAAEKYGIPRDYIETALIERRAEAQKRFETSAREAEARRPDVGGGPVKKLTVQ